METKQSSSDCLIKILKDLRSIHSFSVIGKLPWQYIASILIKKYIITWLELEKFNMTYLTSVLTLIPNLQLI